jgi:hypothetical protein
MIQRLHTGRLVLTPKSPYLLPDDLAALLARLSKIGLIDTPLESGQGYRLGERFMQLVTFMGCSPFIRLEPNASGEPFCHLLIDGPHPRPKLLFGQNTRPPRCPACRKPLREWRTNLETWLGKADRWQASCPLCGHHQDPVTYDFRHSAGCGRLLLCVENIFPQEAIPSPELLNTLKCTSSGTLWHYFYHQD